MGRHLLHSIILVVSLTAAPTGCTLSPVDGQTVASTSSVHEYSGFTVLPNEFVRFEATNNGSTWVQFASTTTEPTPWPIHDTDLYLWKVRAAVPSAQWRAGTTGFVAQVRALVGSPPYRAYTFTADWGDCLTANPQFLDFIGNCRSPRSPNAFIYTSDYPSGIDLVITYISRAVSGGVDVTVRNGGRPGQLQTLTCTANAWAITRAVSAVINPVELQTLRLNLPASAGQEVRCTIVGANEDGSAESDTANNSRTQSV